MAASPPPEADEEVRVVPYDPEWVVSFAEESGRLSDIIGKWATGGIHHVGSTAVPGLAAKPVIDILVGVDDLETSRACIAVVEPLGYAYFPYLTDQMHWFCKPSPSRRTHHLHLVPTGSTRFTDELAFRDYLRAHTECAQQYERLKVDLASRHTHDREAYTQGKSVFVRATLELAHAEA